MNRLKFLGILLSLSGIVSFSHAEEALVAMNFDNADLRVIIKFVSEITGENFIVDENVKGMVTISGPSKIPLPEVRKVLEAVLKTSGYVMVPSGKVTKVVCVDVGQQESVETVSAGQSIEPGDHFVTQIIPLKHGNAEKIAALISSFLTRGGHATAYAPTNTLIVADTASNMARVTRILSDLDQKGLENIPHVYVFHVEHSDAEGIAQVLSQLFEQEKKLTEGRPDPSKDASFVVADPATNALLIHTSKERYPSLRKAIRELDTQRRQVLVEVLIAEVNLDKMEKLGIEWAAVEGVLYGSQEGFGGNRVNKADDIVNNVVTGGKLPGTSASYLHDTLQIGTLQIPRLGILVNAFRNHADINILSTPQILTTDHTEAEILVGENRAFIKNSQVTPEGSTVRTFEFKDIGLSLQLKPHIEPNGLVRMEVHQKVEDVIGQSFEGAVETSKREAKTMITVRDSQTVVIGGLIRERKEKNIQKVPILGDIPILGIPFTRKTDQTVKTNLLIFICPHILDSDEKLSSMTKKKQEDLAAVQKVKDAK